MAIRSGTVRVAGLQELSRALKSLGPELQAELRKTNKDVAENVASHARSAALSIGGVAAKTAPSIRATGGVTSAGVGFGGAAAPYGAGAEFGSTQYTQFKPWRGKGEGAGYFVFPTIRADADGIYAEYTQALERLVRRNFPQ